MSSNILGPEWNLSPDGINIVTENGAIKDTKTILKRALDSDLKAVGKPALSNELSKSQVGKIVLQIQKIRNISAPKAKEESQAAPRMLKITLTDGESYIQAIEVTPINTIARDKTAPGTKVLINGASIVSGFLMISPQNFSVLGGQVEHLYDKWVLAKSVQQNHQYVSNEGAPPWVPFGCKIVSGNQDKSFKSLEKSKDTNAESEFDQQRKDAIAEASTGAVKKTFGGRVKQNVQFTTQNNHQQYNRGRPNDRGDNERSSRKGKFGPRDDDGVEKLQKPSEKVSLFSFLEDKLPITESKKPVAPSPSCNKNNCQTYHQKDPRIQQKPSNRPQYEKPISNHQASKEKPSNQTNSASKPSKPEPTSSSATKNLPQKSITNSSNPNEINSFNTKHTANSSGETNSSSSRSSQQRYTKDQSMNGSTQQQYRSNSDRYSHGEFNQYKNSNDRYPQHSNFDNFSQQQIHYRYGNDRYQPPYPNQQYSNANNYNVQPYNQKPQKNSLPQPGTHNAEMHQLANNLSKISVSNEFASRALRQHLNLGPPKKREGQDGGPSTLNVGDQCLARYWEDGKFYPATIAAITDKTYAVQFKGYGNIEEVLKHDCFSAGNAYGQNRNPNYNCQQNNFASTTMEFRSRRGAPRN